METDVPLSYGLLLIKQIEATPITLTHVFVFLFLVILITFSAFISGSEVAFFGMNAKDKEELKQDKHEKDKTVLKQISKPEYLLATILTANNFINVGIVLLCAHLTNSLFDFSQQPMLGFIIKTVIITFILLLFGEILPKVYANNHALYFSRIMAKPLQFLSRILKPLTSFLVVSTHIVNKRMAEKHQNISRNELSTALELTAEELTEEKELLKGIIKFGNISVVDIMTSRVDVTDIALKSSFQDVINVIVASGFSRIPVYSESLDKVKGILYIKDLLPHLQKKTFRWQSLIRPPYYVPETKMINDLLEEFQSNKIHMAIIVDEYGGTSGIITLEDVLEEIVGEISDEFDAPDNNYKVNKDGTMLFEAKTLIHDFCKITQIEEDVFEEIKGEADSLGGMLLEVHGKMPQCDDEIYVLDYKFKVFAVDDRRIIKVKFYPPKKSEE